jgi:diguanylate cyclase (GGDEF)-like protein
VAVVFLQVLKPLLAPVAVLAAAGLAVAYREVLPPSLEGLRIYGPYVLFAVGAAISLWFHSGRAFLALASLLLAEAGFHIAVRPDAASFPALAVSVAAAVFLPLNFLLAALLPERGLFHYRNYRCLLLFSAEAGIAAWIASAGRSPISGMAWQAVLDHWLLRPGPVPVLGLALMLAGFVAASARALPRRAPLEIGLAGAMVALFIAFQWAATPDLFENFLAAAGAMLTIAVLQDSHRMAFHDELTALPSRRALEERLLALGPTYTIAMVDVDHFKRVNDTFGHDLGDQVLNLVAARLERVGSGGRAFRYGGEEFIVLFDGRKLDDALPQLEAVREAIEAHRMAIRGKDRPKDAAAGLAQRSGRNSQRAVSVTVSMGVAERGDEAPTARDVIRAADRALYRAKQAGRNRVSR